jgi:acyl-CoA reductase-like NAD-dependent aldehyde dehydrogenase
MTIAREEIFGPVAAVLQFRTIGEAVDVANDSIFGLAAGIWTSDLATAHKLARDIDASVIWVQLLRSWRHDPTLGGFKQSGTGRDKRLETLLTVTQIKSVWIHLGG